MGSKVDSPIAGIPPIGVEMAIRETGQFGEGSEDVFEDDEEDEQEEIDSDDLGLLEHSPESNVKSLKPLTRRSIKPKRLFQTEAQKKAREVQDD